MMNHSLRSTAIRCLSQVLSDRKPLDEVLDVAQMSLDSKEAGWLQEVVSGTLRHKARLDYWIDQLAEKKKPSGRLRKALELATYQIIESDRTVSEMVVNETVGWLKEEEGVPPSKFANAILRKIVEKKEAFRNWEFPAKSNLQTKAAWASVPEWMFKAWVKDWNESWAVDYSKFSLTRPKLWVCSQSGGAEPLGERRLSDAEFIQDVSSQRLVSLVASELKRLKLSSPVLDFCAAPGGKSLGLATRGYQVVATDEDSKSSRFQVLKENALKKGQNLVQVKAKVELVDNFFSCVWVDAPCSSSGIIGRHPDIRWNRNESSAAGFSKKQLEVVAEALRYLAPGGVLVYSVCSVFKIEGSDQEKAILELAAQKNKPLTVITRGGPDALWSGAPDGDGFQFLIFQNTIAS